MKKTKFLAWLVILAMVITMLPATAFAGEIEAEEPEAVSIEAYEEEEADPAVDEQETAVFDAEESVSDSDQNTEDSVDLADGAYTAIIDTSLGMVRPASPVQFTVSGDTATLIIDTNETAAKRFQKIYMGKYADITDENKDTIGVTGELVGKGLRFIVEVPKSQLDENLFFVIRYKDGYSADHDGDWYKAKSGEDYYFTLSNITPVVNTELAITNNTNMFKADSASASVNADDSVTLTMALSGTGYHYLYKGTYEQAVANGAATENWIAGYINDAGKWEFQIPIAADELGTDVPVVSISQSYYEQYLEGKNPIERAFFPRQLNVDLAAETLVTDDYKASKTIAVTNNVSMFKPASTATLNTKGGPNSNNYLAELVLPMESANLSEVYIGTPKEAEEAAETIAFDTETSTFTIPVKWIVTPGKPETVVTYCDGEPFVMSFRSANNGKWYGRTATLDEEAGTLVFDPWVDPAPANTVDELIAKIQIQEFTDTTYADCEAAKAAWDALSDAEKLLVEEYDYFGLDTGDASQDDPLNDNGIGDNEILVVSFGTSFNDSRVATIGGVEKAIAAAYPDWSVRRAFTAQIIINHIYARDGEKIDNVEQALDRAVANGVKRMIVQPTHLMHGAEYDELMDALEPYKKQITIAVAEPLLGEVGADPGEINEDKLAVADAVVKAACADAGYADAVAAASDGAAIVLMGHGTEHVANVTYEQMQTAMGRLGFANVFVGTVEGLPESTECSNVIAAVKAAGYKKVYLRPLMVVAGDHAHNDMADPEDEESWFSQFTADGSFDSVECQIHGLGEIAAVQDLYVMHSLDALGQIATDVGFTASLDGEEITDIVRTEEGYDPSYTDWYTGEMVIEPKVPLFTITVPYGTENVDITLNNYVPAYQNYYYTFPQDGSESIYVDYGFGDQVDQYNKVAYAGKQYSAKVDLVNVIRMQTAYAVIEGEYVSDNLYAIAFVYDPKSGIDYASRELSLAEEMIDLANKMEGEEAVSLAKDALAEADKLSDAAAFIAENAETPEEINTAMIIQEIAARTQLEAEVALSIASLNQQVDPSLYTASTYKAYSDAYQGYKAVVMNPEATSRQIEKARNAVISAAADLKVKDTQTLKVGKKSASYDYAKLASSEKSFNLDVTGQAGAVTYDKISGSKYLTVNDKGDVITQKGAPVGSYSAIIQIKAGETEDYFAAEPLLVTVKVKVTQSKQTVKVQATKKTQSVKYSKTKDTTIKNAVKVTGNKTTLSYKINKTKYFKISSKGVITVKKGTPKGKYEVTVTATAKETKNYKKGSGKATFTIKVTK